MVVVLAGDAGEFQRALDHAERRVAVAVHDAIRKRAVVGPDAQRAAVLLAKFHQRRETLADALQFGGVLVVGVFLHREFFRVGVVAGIDAHFLHPLRRLHRGIGLEVDVGDNRHVASTRTQSGDDVLQVRGVLHRRRGDAHDLAADCDEIERLLDGRLGVHRVAGDHGLHADGIFAADGDVTGLDDARGAALKTIERRTVLHGKWTLACRPQLHRFLDCGARLEPHRRLLLLAAEDVLHIEERDE